MFVSLPACISLVWGALCRFGLTLRQSTLARWGQVALLMLSLSTLSWSQCFQLTAPEGYSFHPTGQAPQTVESVVVVDDVNADGKADLITTNYSSSVSVLLGDGQGGFGPPINSATNSTISKLVISDFNGDGKRDLATLLANHNIAILLGDGQGGFSSPTNYALSERANSLAVGDLNEDGKPDLAVAIPIEGSILVFFNNGTGFDAPTKYAFANVKSVVIADFNQDSKPDLGFLYGYNYVAVAVLLNKGEAKFDSSPKISTYVSTTTRSLVVSDFNNDGKLDLLSVEGEWYYQDLPLLGDGQGGFTELTSLRNSSLDFLYQVATGDINSDGNIDLVYTTYVIGTIAVRLGNGQGGFDELTTYSRPRIFSTSIAVADFNQDSKADLAVADANNETGSCGVSVFYNTSCQVPKAALTGLSLINADNGEVIRPLTNGAEFNLATLPTRNLSIRANANQLTSSVSFALTGPQQHSLTDSALPFALFGNTDAGNDIGWSPPAGNYSLTVTPYAQAQGGGAAGQPITVNFTVRDPSHAVTEFKLINADNGQVIGPLTNGQTINLATLPTRNLNVEAVTQPSPIGRVYFSLTMPESYHSKSESTLPYALFGKTPTGAYTSWTPQVGEYGLVAYPFTDLNDPNSEGKNLFVKFTVIDQPTVLGLSLVNADNGQVIGPLTNGQTLDLATLPTRNLSIRANTTDPTRTVNFALTGPQNHSLTDSALPFALFGNTNEGNDISWTPPLGQYSLTITPSGEGLTGQPVTVNFTVSFTGPLSVASLSLVDADNGQVISPLTNGQVLNLSTLPTRRLSIRAEASPNAGSVAFALTGTQQHSKTETNLPFALFGDNGPKQYMPWTPILGNYNLTVTPYSEGYANGAAGQPISVSFTVSETPTLSGLSLVNADNGQVITPLADGQVLNLASLPTRKLSIRAEANQATGSVSFALTGTQQHTKTETNLPFALFGDNGFEQYVPWTPTLGNYSLTATPYSEGYAQGAAGSPVTVNLTVVELEQPTPTLAQLLLINADNGAVISTLTDGQVIDLTSLPTRNLSIRANANPATQRVSFALTGSQQHSLTDSALPFALFGNTDAGVYTGWVPPTGNYSLTVTPIGEASVGPSISLNFSVDLSGPPTVASLSLINADNGQVISALTNGQVLNLSALPTRNLSIRANANQATGSVSFALTGAQTHTNTENNLPFALFGDKGFEQYIPWTPALGDYSLTVTPSSSLPLVVNFRVEDQAAARRAAQSGENRGRLAVSVLGNPTPAESVEVDIRGAAGGSLDVVLLDEQGRIVSQQHVERAEAVEHRQLRLGRKAGLYLLRVATPTEAQTTRVLRVQ